MRCMRWSLVAAALLAGDPALAQRAVSPDDSVVAADALLRVRELSQAGNNPEALRVLQSTLENEGERLLPSAADRDLYLPVRRIVHELLLSTPDLLQRYRDQEGPRAAQLLAAGDAQSVERTRLLTPAGLDATLRLAQSDIENARFESARLYLEQLELHPERSRNSPGAKDAATLAALAASYLGEGREGVRAWARRWADEAGLPPPETIFPRIPELARPGLNPLQSGPSLDLVNLPPAPLQSAVIDTRPQDITDTTAPRGPWMFPLVAGGRVFISDSTGVQARDATTLSPLWAASFSAASPGGTRVNDQFALMMGMSTNAPVDPALPAYGGGIIVAHNAGFEFDARRFPRTVFAYDASDGRLLWGVEPSAFDDRLGGSAVRGPAAIADDVVIVALREQGIVRVNKAHLVGIDLFTGRARWVRMLGTIGSNPFGRGPGRADLTAIRHGVAYRGDEMGVLGAFEAATGRARWVRLSNVVRNPDTMRYAGPALAPAFEAVSPVFVGDDLFYVEPGRNGVVRVSAHDGTLLGRRDGAALGEPRYLVASGGTVVGVGPTRLAFVDAADFQTATVRMSRELNPPGMAGRCVEADGRVLVPMHDALLALDPAHPEVETRLPLPALGNVLTVAAEHEGPSHLIAADARTMHVYVGWEQARALLERRVEALPRDPRPLLDYVELVHRAGHADRLAPLAERAIRLIESDSSSPLAAASRLRLNTMLAGIVRESRISFQDSPGVRPDASSSAVRDMGVIRALLGLMERSANSPDALAAQVLERAWFDEAEGRFREAVEAYQQVLSDDTLGLVRVGASHGRAAGLALASTARDEAASRLGDLLRRAGPAPYAAFDEEARLAVRSLTQSSPAEELESLARRYPASAEAPPLWARIARLRAAEGRPRDARLAAGAGLLAAELSAAIGRPDQEPRIAALAADLIHLAPSPADQGALLRTLRRLADRHPTLIVNADNAPTAVGDLAASLRTRLALRPSTPMVGSTITPEQTIENADPLLPIFRGRPGLATDCVILHDADGARVQLWGVDAHTGLLARLWSIPTGGLTPAVVMISLDMTVIHWPGGGGGSLEAVSNEGRSLWRTQEFATALSLPPSTPNPAQERVPTPLDGSVRADDMLLSTDGFTLGLVQRSGAAVTFSLADGSVLWTKSLPLNRVYEVTHIGPCLVIAGAKREGEGQPMIPVVLSLDSAGGQPRSTLDPRTVGDHPRWLREVRGPDGSDAIMSSATGLTRFSPIDGTIRWTTPGEPGRGAIAGWIVNDALFILDSQLRLWRADARTGKVDPQHLETRDRVTVPVQASASNGVLTIVSSQGVLCFDQTGALVGADALDSDRLEAVGVATDAAVVLEMPDAGFESTEGEAARLLMLGNPGGKLLAAERIRLFEAPSISLVIDNKLIIGQGVATIVLDASPGHGASAAALQSPQ